MNPNDWSCHLALMPMLHQNGFLDPCSPARGRREPFHARAARRAGILAATLLVPGLLVAALLGS